MAYPRIIPDAAATGIAALRVAALQDVFVWSEVRGANRAAKMYLAALFLCYLTALFVVA
jgi:hypothetical protein